VLAADPSAIGSVGVLTVGTRGGRGPGEVRIKIRGGSETFIAWSESPLPRGATVLVIEERGRRAVDVMEWADDPLDRLGDYGGIERPDLHGPDAPA
jgi:hypothetical protein